MCVSVLHGPTVVDSEEKGPGRGLETIGDQAEARKRRDRPTVLDSGHERLAERTSQLELTQPESDPSPADLGPEQAGELRVRPERTMFSNS